LTARLYVWISSLEIDEPENKVLDGARVGSASVSRMGDAIAVSPVLTLPEVSTNPSGIWDWSFAVQQL